MKKTINQLFNYSIIRLFNYSIVRLFGCFSKMGYFADQKGILRRYGREREGWDKHLKNTRNCVLKTMKDKGSKSAAVLGSGWLLDVPIKEMSRYFDKIYLYDIRHPAKIRKQVKLLGNVELRVCDISGFARPVYKYVKQYRNGKKRPPINEIQPLNTLDLDEFDFVFSCNILNQLDILLTEYLSQFFDLTDEERLAFSKNVQKRHIALLPRERSLLVADYEEITNSPEGREASRKISVHHAVVRSAEAKRWKWEFDTKMTYHKDKKTFFEVLAVEI